VRARIVGVGSFGKWLISKRYKERKRERKRGDRRQEGSKMERAAAPTFPLVPRIRVVPKP
jgi:hypothetical protein